MKRVILLALIIGTLLAGCESSEPETKSYERKIVKEREVEVPSS